MKNKIQTYQLEEIIERLISEKELARNNRNSVEIDSNPYHFYDGEINAYATCINLLTNHLSKEKL